MTDLNAQFVRHFHKRRILITGNTGFKGCWLSLWLNMVGAEVMGISLNPPSSPSMYECVGGARFISTHSADIRDAQAIKKVIKSFEPEVVFHLAAQPLVRLSYREPIETLETNIIGTANVLNACRQAKYLKAIIVVTSDKCYQNNEWVWGYRENDPMGGFDPYSTSKGCAELLTQCYRESYFSAKDYGISHYVAIASARAGNVIGGGDWGADRLVPDCIRAISEGKEITIRSPRAIRPWQHVLESLSGYLMLGLHLLEFGAKFDGGWNFAPLNRADVWPVEKVVKKICSLYKGSSYRIESVPEDPHEANWLCLDATKSKLKLNWVPCWSVSEAIEKSVEWYKFRSTCEDQKALLEFTKNQIEEYCKTVLRRSEDF